MRNKLYVVRIFRWYLYALGLHRPKCRCVCNGGLAYLQFHSIMGLVESFDRMTINQHFLKYKPVKPVKEDLKAWWRYAITAVLEEDVKRRTQMWSWKHIVQYR